MTIIDNLIGKKIFRWTVISKSENKNSKITYLCRCVCGKTKEVAKSSLVSEKSKSCGCLQKEQVRKTLCKKRICKLEDCTRKHYCKGFCSRHHSDYYNGRRDINGTPINGYQPLALKCKVAGCSKTRKDHLRNGFCTKHRKWREKGIVDEAGALVDPNYKPSGQKYYHCKISGCLKKHRRNGFCQGHSSSYKSGVIDIDGKRIFGKRNHYNYASGNVRCKVRTCTRIMDGKTRKTKLINGFCTAHYSWYKRGHYSIWGMLLRPILTKEEVIKNLIKMGRKNGRKNAIKITWEGETKTIRAWSRLTKIPHSRIKERYNKGLPLDFVFSFKDLRNNEKYKEYVKKAGND